MPSSARFAEIAALAGDPARASMLFALMDGRALTAGELARSAGVSAQTASGHLARMAAAGLIAVEKQGRHRYHRLALPSVAHMLESIMQVAAAVAPADDGTRRRLTVGPRDAALREARTCYDHLAGRLGVAIADAMIKGGQVELASDGGLVTSQGMALLRDIGLATAMFDEDAGARGRRVLCRPCLDWSERRPHLAGRLGALICKTCLEDGWVRRIEGTRALAVTPKGRRNLQRYFGIA